MEAEGSNPIILRNRYRVLERLGEGGAGTVYLVDDLYEGASAGGSRGAPPRLALKAVLTDDHERAVLESLRHEFQILAVLRHPLIGKVYDFGRLPRQSGLQGCGGRSGYFYTRDMIPGADLRSHCDGLDLAQICRVCQRTAEALDVLHRAGMVHGDLKPANVIVSHDGLPHLIDFGLGRSEGQSVGSSGTLPYLAPEILLGQPEDRRADLYSLGITIYSLVTGSLPKRKARTQELVSWHLTRGSLRLPAAVQAPAQLDRLVTRLTHPNPENRFPSAVEVALALAEAAEAAGGGVAPPRDWHFVPPAPGQNLVQPLQELEARVRARTLDGEGGCALATLEGGAGAGKSTLLKELAWRCQLQNIEVVRAEFRAGDLRIYEPWRGILRQVAGITKICTPLGELANETAPYDLLQRISDFIGRAAEQLPLLLLLDNGEQANAENRATLRYITHTLDARAAVMVVLAHRPSAELQAVLGGPPCITLAPLSGEDVATMVQDASGRRDDDLAARIRDSTDGNPLFMMEVLEQLGRQGWPANPDLARLLPPLGLEELHTRRFRELEQPAQSLLEALSVAGRPAGPLLLVEVVAEALGQAPELSVARALREHEWIDQDPDGTLRFGQGHVSRIIYAQIPPSRRRALHLSMTAVVSRAGAIDPVEQTHHAVGAGRPDQALESFDDAVALLKRCCAHRSAIQLCEAVLPLLEGNRETSRRIRRELGECFYAVGDLVRAREELTLAGDDEAVTVPLARAHRLTGDPDKALALLQAALERQSGPGQRVAILSELAEAQQALDDSERVLKTVRQALELLTEARDAGQAADLATRAELRGQLAFALGILERFGQAERTWALALADAQACGEQRVEANLLNRWAITAYNQGAMNQVSRRYHAALECARRAGDVERIAAIGFNLASFHFHQGELTASLRDMPQSVRLFEAMGAQKNLVHGYSTLGLLQRELGLYEQARVTLEQARDAARRVGARLLEALSVLILGLVQSERGHRDEASGLIAEARRLFAEAGRQMDEADALLDLASVELDGGDVAAAQEALDAARAAAGNELRPDLQIRATALQARIAAAPGGEARREGVLTALNEALTSVRALGSRALRWRSHAAAMELHAAMGRPRESEWHARIAMEVLERMAEDLPPEVQLAFWQQPLRRAVRRGASPESMQDRYASPLEELEETATLELQVDEPDTIKDIQTGRPSSPITVIELGRTQRWGKSKKG